VFLAFLVLVAIFGKYLAPKDPTAQNLERRFEGASGDFLLGTDSLGRDTFSRLIFATRVTLSAAGEALLVAVVIGVPLGLIAGYTARVFDAVVSRFADAVLSLPPLVFAFAIVGVLGTGVTNAMLAVGIVLSPRFYRIARAAAADVRDKMYIEAARADGGRPLRILLRHVLPNSSGPLLVQASFSVGTAIMAEASLSFLGLGVQAPESSWGSMIRDGFNGVKTNAFPILPPAVMVTATILAMFMLGDGLRDAIGRTAGDD
jgi:peptide/nickel transport system permease protein